MCIRDRAWAAAAAANAAAGNMWGVGAGGVPLISLANGSEATMSVASSNWSGMTDIQVDPLPIPQVPRPRSAPAVPMASGAVPYTHLTLPTHLRVCQSVATPPSQHYIQTKITSETQYDLINHT